MIINAHDFRQFAAWRVEEVGRGTDEEGGHCCPRLPHNRDFRNALAAAHRRVGAGSVLFAATRSNPSAEQTHPVRLHRLDGREPQVFSLAQKAIAALGFSLHP